MYGIKYFFLNKNNQTIQEGAKKISRGTRAENITEKHYFSKSRGGTCPPWILLGPPLVSSRGEHVLAAAGEVHLERCVKDLRERFARVSLEVSPPLVSFKETIEGEGVNVLEKTTLNGRCAVKVQVVKLPGPLTKVLEENAELLGEILEGKSGDSDNTSKRDDESLLAFRKKIISAVEAELEAMSGQSGDKEKVEKYRKTWLRCLQRIWFLGPRQVGPNLLIIPENICADSNAVLIQGSCHVSERLGFVNSDTETTIETPPLEESEAALLREAEGLKSSVVSGFQLATSAGPLCDDPMWGLAFIFEPYIFPDNSENAHQSDQYGIFTGQVMTAVKEACKAVVLQNNPRLVEIGLLPMRHNFSSSKSLTTA
jgi:ribosome assembly protein 1